MSSYYTSELLIESVKRRITIPTNQNTFTDRDILRFADEELGLSVVPAIMTLHEDYLLYSEDMPLVQNQREYVIPYRAVGNKLYDLQFVTKDNNGKVMTISTMSRTTAADEPQYRAPYTTNNVYCYYVKNNRIVLMPQLGAGPIGFLRFIYYIRPSSLVLTRDVGVISNINRTTGELTVTSLPSTFSTSTPLDFYQQKSPHIILKIDLMASSINPTSDTLTFNTDDIPDELQVGDQIALAQECAIPQIPSDLHVFLAQKTAERILEAQGDTEGLKLAMVKSAEMEARSGTLIDNRVEESPVKLINRSGILRNNLLSRFYRRGW